MHKKATHLVFIDKLICLNFSDFGALSLKRQNKNIHRNGFQIYPPCSKFYIISGILYNKKADLI